MGCVPLGWSGSGSVIQDHSDHGRSNDPMNPLWTMIHRFIRVGSLILTRIIPKERSHGQLLLFLYRSKSDLLYYAEYLPTISTQLKIISSVKAATPSDISVCWTLILDGAFLWMTEVQSNSEMGLFPFFNSGRLYCSKVESLLSSNCASGLPLDLLDWEVTF